MTDISGSLTDEETATVKKATKGMEVTGKVYKADKDGNKSVLYAELGSKSDLPVSPRKDCTAVIMKNNATLYGSLGSTSVGGSPKMNVIGAYFKDTPVIDNLTLDSWDEVTEIEPTLDPGLKKFKILNLDKGYEIDQNKNGMPEKLFSSPDKSVYDAKSKTWLGSSVSVSPCKRDLSNGLYASSKDTWNDLIKANFEDIAINTGDIKKDGDALDYQMSINVKQPTTMTLSYTPADRNRYYSKIDSLKVNLYPLSQFSDHILELCKDKMVPEGAENGYADQWKAVLTACKDEYAKLSDNAKETKEVNLTIAGNTVICTPTEVLNTYLSNYVLSSAVRDLCEYKNNENPSTPYTEKAILESIDSKKLSSEDKQYLLEKISANYDKLGDGFGEEFEKFAKSPVDALVTEIKDVPADDSSKNNEDKKNSDGSSSGSSGSSSGSSSSGSSGKSSPGKSSSIKTGSESLLMLVSSFGLSSGALLSLRKKK
jgi:uncharacterized membrane protein YgcG